MRIAKNSMMWGVRVVLLAALASVGCSRSGGAQCAYENWRGMCQLQTVDEVRVIGSMPTIAVMEASYEPQSSGSGQTLLPPAQRVEYRVRVEQEADLREHLQKYPLVECRFQQRRAGSCAEGSVEVMAPPFEPPPPPDLTVDAGASGPSGCAELEHGRMAAQGPDAELPQGVPVEIFFQVDSAEASPEIERQVAELAQTLTQHPEIECLAVIGHVTAGERMMLGNERAATVKNLLVSRGIQSTRLQSIAAVVPMTGGAPRAVIPEDRKVRLRVLLRKQ